jgi:hypothetical protein
MNRKCGTEELDDAQVGWACARLLTMARTAATNASQLVSRLEEFDAPTVFGNRGAALRVADLGGIVADVFALQDGVDVMGSVANSLREHEDDVIVARNELRDEAAHALASASPDPSFVLLAASMLTATEGFPAMADALIADTSAVSSWGGLTARDLLGTFAESDTPRIRRICSMALIHPDAPLATLDPDLIERLAEALRTTDV